LYQFDKGLGGGSGPQRWIRALGEETGNPIMAFHRPSFFPLGFRVSGLGLGFRVFVLRFTVQGLGQSCASREEKRKQRSKPTVRHTGRRGHSQPRATPPKRSRGREWVCQRLPRAHCCSPARSSDHPSCFSSPVALSCARFLPPDTLPSPIPLLVPRGEERGGVRGREGEGPSWEGRGGGWARGEEAARRKMY